MPQINAGIPRKRLRSILLVGILSVGIMAIAAGGGYVVWRQLVASDNQDYQALVSLDNQMTAQSKYVQAAQLWTDYTGRTTNSDHKASAYVNAALDLINAHKYTDAITLCRKAEALKGVTIKEAGVAALGYSGEGDKSRAIQYYREAIKLVPPGQAGRDYQIAILNQEISTLEAQP